MSPADSRGQPDPQLASARQWATLAALRGPGHVKAVQMGRHGRVSAFDRATR